MREGVLQKLHIKHRGGSFSARSLVLLTDLVVVAEVERDARPRRASVAEIATSALGALKGAWERFVAPTGPITTQLRLSGSSVQHLLVREPDSAAMGAALREAFPEAAAPAPAAETGPTE